MKTTIMHRSPVSRVGLVALVALATSSALADSYTNTIQTGYNLIANQLAQGSNTLDEIMPSVPDQTTLSKWDKATQAYLPVDTFFDGFGWFDTVFNPSTNTLQPGEGARLSSPNAFSLVFTGTPITPVLPVPVDAQWQLLSAQTPEVAGYSNVVGQVPMAGAEVVVWDPIAQDFITNIFNGVWSPTNPILNVGESAFFRLTTNEVDQSYSISIQTGYNLIANQLDQGSNTLNEIMPVMPDGCVLYKRNNIIRGWVPSVYSSTAGSWLPGDVTLSPGEGAFLQSPTNFNLSIVGTPHVPVLPVTIPSGACYLLSRQTNDIGTYDNIVGTNAQAGAQVFKWAGSGYELFTKLFLPGQWSPSVPTAAVGEAMWIAPNGGSPPPQLLVITQQPQDLSVLIGQPATFTVVAAGTEFLTYQWQFSGANLLGATNATLTIASALFADAGEYTVSVSNSLEGVLSQPAMLEVDPLEEEIDAAAPGWVRGGVVIMFTPDVAADLRSALATNAPFASLSFPSGVAAQNQMHAATALVQAHPGISTNAQHLEDIFLLTVNPEEDMEVTCAAYAAQPQVVFAEPDRIARAFANDEFFVNQWALAKVDASTAWLSSTGDGIVIAVVDSGVDYTHCDLVNNIWVNLLETDGNGIDDDGNDFDDDRLGWDFVQDDNTPSDPNGHGTHVAGSIAAVFNNSEGIAGLAPTAKIMALRGLDQNGRGATSGLAKAMTYAVKNGARIINNSWGGPGWSDHIAKVVDYATSEGVLVVCAAGNDAQNACGFYPANVEHSLTVAATTPTDTAASYSNYGTKLDVAAPGGANSYPPNTANAATDILSTTPTTSTLSSKGYPQVTGSCGKYMPISGTSMAAPHVAALAALIWQLHPTWTVEEVRQTIRRSADPLGSLIPGNGFDTAFGYGRINAAAAVAMNQQWPVASVTVPRNCATIVSGTSASALDVIGSAGGLNFDHYDLEIAPGVNPAPSAFGTLTSSGTPVNNGVLFPNLQQQVFANGSYTLRLTTFNSSNEKSEDRNEINARSVFLTSPVNAQILTSPTVPVEGTVPASVNYVSGGSVLNGDFQSYTLSWRPVGGSAPNVFFAASTYSSGFLANWDLALVSHGEIVLELEATYTGAGVIKDSVTVRVDKLLKSGWPVLVNSRPSMKSPLAADLDGNGAKSIIYGASVFNPDGTLRSGWDANPGLGRSNPAIVDVNNDGKLEIIAAVFSSYLAPGNNAPNNGGIVVYCYPPSGKATPLWSYEVHNPTTTGSFGVPSSISVGDVDGDAQLEAVFTVCFYGDNNETWLFVLDAIGGTLKYSKLIPGISWNSVALANLDAAKDDALEMVVTSDMGELSPQTTVLQVTGVTINDLPGWPQSGGGYNNRNIDPVVADVDHDGNYEILVSRYLWRADGTSFSAAWPSGRQSRSTGAFAPPLPQGSNMDCDLDLILGAQNQRTWYRMNHSGTLLQTTKTTGESVLTIWLGENGKQGNPIVADITGDGIAEVVRPPELGFSITGISKIYASASSQFPLLAYNPDRPIYSTALVDDVDGDGKTDLLICIAGKLYWWNLNQQHFLNAQSRPWPTFQHDNRHTGTIPLDGDGFFDYWIQDTPYNYSGAPDTGLEPDPAMAGKHMWLSRAIWVHNDPGPALDFSTHQNPEFGQENVIFAEIQNRGCFSSNAVVDAVVKLYAAPASTGLRWPNSWALVGSENIPSLAHGDYYTASIPWLPADIGHYCLLAVVESDKDPLSLPNTDNVNLLTKMNNNVAWRNLNVVNLVTKISGGNKFRVHNLADQAKPVTLQFTANEDFLETGGELTVDLHDLHARWQTNGAQGLNVTNTGGTTVSLTGSPATLAGINFSADEDYELDLTVGCERLMPVPGTSHVYHIEVIQIVDEQNVGGIGYAVTTLAQDGVDPLEPYDVSATVLPSGSSFSISWPDATGVDRILQESTNLVNWLDIPGANSPYFITPSEPKEFFRVRQ